MTEFVLRVLSTAIGTMLAVGTVYLAGYQIRVEKRNR